MIRRPPTLARNGMIASSHPLASEAGAAMLRAGGHAVDAAVAAAAVLSVVEPWSGGAGGDAFLLIYDKADGAVTAINGNGAAPSGLAPGVFAGLSAVPADGPLSATVPGCVDAWHEAWYGWGRLEWSRLIAPAVSMALDGFPVSWNMGRVLRRERVRLAKDPGLAALYLHPDLSPLNPGEICRPHALGSVLDAVARNGAEHLYRGPLARRLCKAVRDAGGVLSTDDLEQHESRLLPPYEYRAGECVFHQQPMPSQGVMFLLLLSLMDEGTEGVRPIPDPRDELHRQIQACRAALVLRDLLVGDPRRMPVAEKTIVDAVLDPRTAARLGRLIRQEPVDPALWRQVVQDAVSGPDCPLGPVIDTLGRMPARGIDARDDTGGDPDGSIGGDHDVARGGDHDGSIGGDTTYLCAADQYGNVVGLIQSIFSPFGCGFMDPETGIVLNNRAAAFSLEPSRINRLEPGKRPMHTLNSYIALRDGRPVLVSGTPGADRQIQTSLQVFRHLQAARILWPGPMPMKPGNWNQAREPEACRPALEKAELLAAALEAPRWGLRPDGRVEMEARMPAAIRDRLGRMGHDIVRIGPWSGSGRVQAIEVLGNGVFCGATDPRAEGSVAGL